MRRLLVRAAATALAAAATTLAVVPTSGAGDPQPVAQSQAGTRSGPDLTFATWNFCNHTCGDYTRRLAAMARTVQAVQPDVLALQEVDVRGNRLTLVEDRLDDLGYVNTNPTAHVTCPEKCEAHLFIRASQFRVTGADESPRLTDRCQTLLDDVEWSRLNDDLYLREQDLRDQLDSATTPDDETRDSVARARLRTQLIELGAQKRALRDERYDCELDQQDLGSFESPTFGYLPMARVSSRAAGNPASFAFLEHVATGARLLAVSLHLDKQNGTDLHGPDDRARNAAALGLARWTKQRAAEQGLAGIPTIMMGDFNSYLRKQPRGPQWVLQREGFVIADKARVGRNYATVNKVPVDARWNGFPPKPRVFPDLGPQIDTVMARGAGAPKRFEVYVKTLPNGRFDERFRASDHNLVRAIIPIPR